MSSTTTLTPQQKVCAILQWPQQKHSQLVYDCGLAFLYHYLPLENEFMIHCITSSRIYWNWWKLHWQSRDQVFADYHFTLVRLQCAEDLYKELHDPRTLANELYPNGMVLSESYANMIGELNKSEVAA